MHFLCLQTNIQRSSRQLKMWNENCVQNRLCCHSHFHWHFLPASKTELDQHFITLTNGQKICYQNAISTWFAECFNNLTNAARQQIPSSRHHEMLSNPLWVELLWVEHFRTHKKRPQLCNRATFSEWYIHKNEHTVLSRNHEWDFKHK